MRERTFDASQCKFNADGADNFHELSGREQREERLERVVEDVRHVAELVHERDDRLGGGVVLVGGAGALTRSRGLAMKSI